MIEPTETVFAFGYIVGIFTTIIAGGVAVILKSKGKVPEYIEIPNEHEDGHWICPDCGMNVSFYELRNNYCSECGLKIDWSEKREKKPVRRIRFKRK